jgi:hypothetical protein
MGTRLRLRDGVLAQTTLVHAVLLDSVSGEYFELNPVGSVIVRGLIAGEAGTAIVDAIVAQFAVEPARARGDLQTFIDGLVARGLLVSSDA